MLQIDIKDNIKVKLNKKYVNIMNNLLIKPAQFE